MSYKTILVHCDAGKPAPARLGVALDLARRFGAHLVGVYVRPRFEAPIFSDGSLAMESLYLAYDTQVKTDEAAAAAPPSPRRSGPRARRANGASPTAMPTRRLAELAHGADLVIVGQREAEPASGTPPDLAERLALHTERPVLVVPYIGGDKSVGKNVLLCWNGHREAGRAASGALPLLKRADKVTVLAIDPPHEEPGKPVADVVAWLTRHGVKASLVRDSAADTDIGDIILSRAADGAADLVVMGVYGHSRMREMVMGGASRTVLASMTVPVLVAH